MKTTNYNNTFIEVAQDCPVTCAEVPPVKGQQTVAHLQFTLIHEHPYKYTSDDVIFITHATRLGIPKTNWKEEREKFFSKGQACLRSSPLAKRYGWGIHYDAAEKVAIYAIESPDYKNLMRDKKINAR